MSSPGFDTQYPATEALRPVPGPSGPTQGFAVSSAERTGEAERSLWSTESRKLRDTHLRDDSLVMRDRWVIPDFYQGGQEGFEEDREVLRMNSKKFAKRTEGETLEDIVHRSRKRAQEVLEDQGIAAVALTISEMMARSIEASKKVILKVMASLLLWAVGLMPGDVWAKSEYIIGEDEHPWAESGTFKQMDTMTDPDWIQIVYVDPDENLMPGLWDRGGKIEAPRYSIIIQYSDEDKHRMVDGDATTAFVCRPEYGIGGWQSNWITFDLGAPFPLNKIRFQSREEFRSRIIREYIVQVWDGRRTFYSALWRYWYPIYQLIRKDTNNLNPVVELTFPTQLVQAVRILPGPRDRTWELAEMEAYGEGYVPLPATYTSQVIDLKDVGDPGTIANWGKIRWEGWRDEGAKVEIQTRSGDDDTPDVYWRKTGVGDEQVWWSESGKPLTKKEYEHLEVKAVGRITYDMEHWSFWSAPYDFEKGLEGVPVASPSPRRYFQIQVKITPTSTDGAGLDYIAFEFSHKIPAYEILAEISPIEVSPRQAAQFTYALRPRIGEDNTGFDALEITTPMRADTVRSVRIDRMDVAFTVETQEDRFVVRFPKVTRDQTLVEVDFDCLVLSYTRFDGRVFDSNLDEPHQLVSPGEVTDRLLSNSLSVRSALEEPIISSVEIGPNPFTPNGDGINDVLDISYSLLRLAGSAPVLLGIYDPSGALVKEVYRGEDRNGRYVQHWDGKDEGGEVVLPGMYLVRLCVQADQGEESKTGTVAVVY